MIDSTVDCGKVANMTSLDAAQITPSVDQLDTFEMAQKPRVHNAAETMEYLDEIGVPRIGELVRLPEIFAGNAYQTSEIGGGVYRSTNAGQTWARIDPKDRRLPSQRIWALAFDAHDQNVLFVGSHSAGVYVVPRTNDTLSSAQQQR